MPFRTAMFVFALTGLLLSASGAFCQTDTENEPWQEEGTTGFTKDSQEEDDRSPNIVPALEDIETAIRDLIVEENKIEVQRREDADNRSLKAQETMAFWARWMFYAAVASIIVTLAALYTIIMTLHHTRRAADYTKDMLVEARKATSAVNRAWIKVSPKENGSYFIDQQGGISFNVEFEIENVGNTPAMKVHTQIEAVPDYDEARSDASDLAKREVSSEFEETGRRIAFANEKYTRPWAPSIDGAVFKERGYVTAVIIGCVSYRTSYDNDLHQTVFVFGVTFEGGDISPQKDNGVCEFFVLSGGFAT